MSGTSSHSFGYQKQYLSLVYSLQRWPPSSPSFLKCTCAPPHIKNWGSNFQWCAGADLYRLVRDNCKIFRNFSNPSFAN